MILFSGPSYRTNFSLLTTFQLTCVLSLLLLTWVSFEQLRLYCSGISSDINNTFTEATCMATLVTIPLGSLAESQKSCSPNENCWGIENKLLAWHQIKRNGKNKWSIHWSTCTFWHRKHGRFSGISGVPTSKMAYVFAITQYVFTKLTQANKLIKVTHLHSLLFRQSDGINYVVRRVYFGVVPKQSSAVSGLWMLTVAST